MQSIQSKLYVLLVAVGLLFPISYGFAQSNENYKNTFINMERVNVPKKLLKVEKKLNKKLTGLIQQEEYQGILANNDTLAFHFLGTSKKVAEAYHQKSNISGLTVAYTNLDSDDKANKFIQLTEELKKDYESKLIPSDNEAYYRVIFINKNDTLTAQFLADKASSAKFPKGYWGIRTYVNSNMKYPDFAFKLHVNGKCIVTTTIDEEGQVIDAKIAGSSRPEFEEEALRLIRNMPKWEPYCINDVPRKARLNIPIYFKCQFANFQTSFKELDDIEAELRRHAPNPIQEDHTINVMLRKKGDAIEIVKLNIFYKASEDSEMELDKDVSPAVQNKIREIIIKSQDQLLKVWSNSFEEEQATLAFHLYKKGNELRLISFNSKSTNDSMTYCSRPDQKADFEGGVKALLTYIGKNLKYPAISQYRKVEGKILLTFMVEKDGFITGIRILKGLDEYTEAESLRIVSQMPRWNPAISDGIPVRTRTYLPIKFSLPY